jgi:hypothetical protein
MPNWLVDPVTMEGRSGRVSFVPGARSARTARMHHPWARVGRTQEDGVILWERCEDESAWCKAQNRAVAAAHGIKPRPSRPQPRTMPTVTAIWMHWRGSFAGPTPQHCFACGCEAGTGFNLERAHILARAEGGDDSVSNLHILCRPCHQESEMLSGGPYFAWLMR